MIMFRVRWPQFHVRPVILSRDGGLTRAVTRTVTLEDGVVTRRYAVTPCHHVGRWERMERVRQRREPDKKPATGPALSDTHTRTRIPTLRVSSPQWPAGALFMQQTGIWWTDVTQSRFQSEDTSSGPTYPQECFLKCRRLYGFSGSLCCDSDSFRRRPM